MKRLIFLDKLESYDDDDDDYNDNDANGAVV